MRKIDWWKVFYNRRRYSEWLRMNPNASVQEIYAKAEEIIRGKKQ